MRPILIPDRVNLQEPPQQRRVEPRVVIIQAQLGYPDLPGILEPPDVAARWDAPGVIAVQAQGCTAVVGCRDYAAQMVALQIAAVGKCDRCP